MTYKFEFFSKKQMTNIYLTESMRSDWLHMLDDYWDEKYTPYSDDDCFWPDWLYQYVNELPIGEAIKSAYITYNSEQNRLTPKYEIMRSLVTLVKHYF